MRFFCNRSQDLFKKCIDNVYWYLNLWILMYHVGSSPNVKLSYLLSPGLLNLFLPKFDREISSIPKSLVINTQIQILYIFIRNSGIVLSKMLKQANLIISRITFCVKKSGLELDQSSTLVKLKLITFPVF